MRDLNALAAYIAGREKDPFVWGQHDCVLFAAGAVEVLTGADPLAGIGRWTSELGAQRVLAKHGGLDAAVSSVLTPIATGHAHRGDIAGVEDERGLYLMVIEGMTLVGPGPERLMRLPRAHMVKAWRSVA